MSSVREKVVEKSRFLKHFRFCASCLTIGAVPLLRLSRNRESANVKVLYFVGSDQKCGTKFSACRAHWWQKKKKKQFFLVSREVLFLKKKSRKTKNRFNSPVCPWDFRLAASVYTPRDSQQQLSGAMQFYHFPNHVSCQILSEKRLKCLLLSKWFFRCIPSLFL